MLDSGALSGTWKIGMARARAKERVEPSLRAAVDAFLSSARCANTNTRRAYTAVLDRLLADLGDQRRLGDVSGDELADVLEAAWGGAGPATWNRNRARSVLLALLVRQEPIPGPGPAAEH